MAKKSQADEAFTQATPDPTNNPGAEVDAGTAIYEVGFHVVPTVAQDGIGKVVGDIKALMGSDAEIISEGAPARMPLAYTIERATQGKREKYSEAYFGWIKFAHGRTTMPALEAALTANRDVLRFLIIETLREDIQAPKARAVFGSSELEGKPIEAPKREKEVAAEVSEVELDKSIDALTQE